jgi:hypothetical protein
LHCQFFSSRVQDWHKETGMSDIPACVVKINVFPLLQKWKNHLKKGKFLQNVKKYWYSLKGNRVLCSRSGPSFSFKFHW